MKLLIITAISTFEKDIKKMLKQAEVKTFSYKEVKGYKDISEESVEKQLVCQRNKRNRIHSFLRFCKKGKCRSII